VPGPFQRASRRIVAQQLLLSRTTSRAAAARAIAGHVLPASHCAAVPVPLGAAARTPASFSTCYTPNGSLLAQFHRLSSSSGGRRHRFRHSRLRKLTALNARSLVPHRSTFSLVIHRADAACVGGSSIGQPVRRPNCSAASLTKLSLQLTCLPNKGSSYCTSIVRSGRRWDRDNRHLSTRTRPGEQWSCDKPAAHPVVVDATAAVDAAQKVQGGMSCSGTRSIRPLCCCPCVPTAHWCAPWALPRADLHFHMLASVSQLHSGRTK
jgi:hypothetical protein